MNYSFLRHLTLAALAAGVFSGNAFAGDATKGKVAYVKNGCYQCHGTVGQGGAGAKLAPKPLPEEAFVNFVRTTNRAMPPYREAILPSADLADIYAFLQSVPKPKDVGSIPLLK